MQALVVVLQRGDALLLAAVVRGGGVDDVAGEDFLPEGEAARWPCGVSERGMGNCAAQGVRTAVEAVAGCHVAA